MVKEEEVHVQVNMSELMSELCTGSVRPWDFKYFQGQIVSKLYGTKF